MQRESLRQLEKTLRNTTEELLEAQQSHPQPNYENTELKNRWQAGNSSGTFQQGD